MAPPRTSSSGSGKWIPSERPKNDEQTRAAGSRPAYTALGVKGFYEMPTETQNTSQSGAGAIPVRGEHYRAYQRDWHNTAYANNPEPYRARTRRRRAEHGDEINRQRRARAAERRELEQ